MKILCILYDDPKDGMPTSYPVKDLPKLEKYPDGMTLPTPKGSLSERPCSILRAISSGLLPKPLPVGEEYPSIKPGVGNPVKELFKIGSFLVLPSIS